MSHYYPEGNDALYYVEFERGDRKGEFTLFKRMWFYSKEELLLKKIQAKHPNDFAELSMTNEGHPWNIFTATYGPPGCMPDETWIKFMVDALNEKAVEEERKQNIAQKHAYDEELCRKMQEIEKG